jgi:hypothetical protein
MEAQAMKAASEANAADAALKIEAFDRLIQMHKDYGDMLNKRIAALTGEGNAGESSDGGGVRGMEGKSGDQGDSSVSVKVPGGSEVSVGNGAAAK